MATKRIGEGMTHRTTLDGTERFLVTPGPDETVASADMEFSKIEDLVKPDIVNPDNFTTISRAALKALLDLKINLSQKGVADGVATLGPDGKIPACQLPALAVVDVYPVSSQAAMLACAAEQGDIAVRTDSNQVFILAASPASTLANWVELSALKALVDAAIADLAGAGRTTETVKGNADDIAEIETQIASLETQDQTNDEQLVRISKEVQDTKEAMASNSNAPKLVTEGIGSVSLPSNATGVAKVGTEGVSVKNLVPAMVDSDADGLADGWSGAEATNYSFVDGVQTFTPTNIAGQMRRAFTTGVVGHKYCAIALVNAQNTNVFLEVWEAGGKSALSYATILGSFSLLIATYTKQDATDTIRVGIGDISSSGWSQVQFSEVRLIDLTISGLASYTTDQLAQMLPTYFSGTRHFSGVGCVRTTGRNLFKGNLYEFRENAVPLPSDVWVDAISYQMKPNMAYTVQITLANAYNYTNVLVVTNSAGPSTYVALDMVGVSSATITTGSDGVLWVGFDRGLTWLESDMEYRVQINEGSSALPYSPYEEHDFFFLGSELRRVPSAYDEQVGDVRTQRVGGPATLDGSLNWGQFELNPLPNTIVMTVSSTSILTGQRIPTGDNITFIATDGFPTALNWAADIEGIYLSNVPTVVIRINKSRLASVTLQGAKDYLTANPIKIWYELAIPIISTIPTSGTPLAKSNGMATYYPWIQDVGIYDDGLTLATPATEIVALEVYDSPYEPPTVVTDGVIASGGLSVTSASIANGKVVRIVYAFEEPINPPMSLEYFNDVLTVEDSVTGKRYTYKPTVASGAITGWTLVEV